MVALSSRNPFSALTDSAPSIPLADRIAIRAAVVFMLGNLTQTADSGRGVRSSAEFHRPEVFRKR